MQKIPPNNLDKTTVAICECNRNAKTITFRSLKNKWPICKCKKPMKVKGDNATVPPI